MEMILRCNKKMMTLTVAVELTGRRRWFIQSIHALLFASASASMVDGDGMTTTNFGLFMFMCCGPLWAVEEGVDGT